MSASPTRAVGRVVLLPAMLAALLMLAAVGPAAALSSAYPHLSVGNRGADVKALQHLLRQHGATLGVSGIFGVGTVRAVRAFQAANALAETGAADARTWTALVVPLATGSTGEAVLGLKRLLNEKRGAGLALTATFDEATRTAVIRFQEHTRILANGRAGPTVWRLLLAHLERPVFGTALCDYSVGNGPADWGTGAAIGQLEAAAAIVRGLGHGRIAIGDIGFEHGGDIPGHSTHEHGMDVDIRPMRDARDQCRWGGSYRMAAYDRAATRDLIRAIRSTAPGHVKLIYFNDPVLIREGLVRRFDGHDDHLHVRYCERIHPVAAHDC
jgi:peptidoglycan hydrolase-like protein with peptidoglycan-binding domain